MKTLLRILAVLFVLLLVVLVSGYFALTNAGIQKRLVEGQLPAGSSIESIHVTTGKVSLSGLVLMLPDGTRVQVGSVDTPFEPLAAVFDRTIKMGVLRVDGLRVDLPAVAQATSGGGTSTGTQSASQVGTTGPASSNADAATNPMDALYAMGKFDWLFDIEGLALEAVINDGKGSEYVVRVDSPAIRPGTSSQIVANLKLISAAPLASGLKSFESNAILSFQQKAGGGFESLKFESNTSGEDAQGNALIAIAQSLDLAVDDSAGKATVALTFDANLPKPQVLAPELATLGALKASGNLVASTDGTLLTLSSANVKASASEVEILSMNLKRSMVFGGAQDLEGDLLDLSVTGLQLEWINPWLGEGMRIESEAPISFSLSVAGAPAGAFKVTFAKPIELGPLSVYDSGTALVQDLVLIVSPEVQLNANQTVQYKIGSLSVADRYGSFLQGSFSGRVDLNATRDEIHPFAGIQTQANLEIGLQELFQLPVLAESASIVSGQLSLNLVVDESAKQPLYVETDIKGLRASSMPGSIRDYSLVLGLSPASKPGEWQIGADILAGPASRPSTSLQFSGSVNPSQEPIVFTAALSGPSVTQEDLSILAAAFTPRESVAAAPAPARPSDSRGAPSTQAPRHAGPVAVEPVPPAWSMLDGKVSVQIDALRLDAGQVIEAIQLKAAISEPKLSVDTFSAKIGSGELKGSSSVLYAQSQLKPYSLTADVRFTDIDPAFFLKKHNKTAPVQGQFDGIIEVVGVGETLESAIEDSTAKLKITGDQGVLTAFELDGYKQAGLAIVGDLLGRSSNPNLAAVTNVIPYFKDIRFDSFAFELTRGADKQVQIPQLRITGESLLLDASGLVGAGKLSEVMQQPLNLKVTFGAKGQLSGYLDTLGLLRAAPAEDGFTRWNKDVAITGSLADPDTSALMGILNDAAKGALVNLQKKDKAPAADTTKQLPADPNATTGDAVPAEVPKKKSKDERRRDDIEMGLDLLNSLIGN